MTDLVKQVSIIACKPFAHGVLHDNGHSSGPGSGFPVQGSGFRVQG
ncbi:MAG: hypothetical protein GY864_06090 [Desulfobacterales bacterium]|nr:hypothetical protein [Desulfobacterales bacterium]